MKLNKKGLSMLEKLLNSYSVNDYHETLLKSIKVDSEANNLQTPDRETLEDLINMYPYVFYQGVP